jgi:o-succinylbenzoate synthase
MIRHKSRIPGPGGSGIFLSTVGNSLRVITFVDCHLYQIPIGNTFTTAHGSLPVRAGAIVEVHAGNSIVGFGDIAPLPEFGCGTLFGALNALPELARCIRAMSVDEALTFLWHHVNKYPSSLVSGIELALLDIQGKVRGCPVHQLLLEWSEQSGTCTARKRVSVNAVVGAATLEAAINEAQAAVSKGFGCVKLKVAGARSVQGTTSGASPTATVSAQDYEQAIIERVAAVRHAIGPAVHLRLDANEGWSFEQAKTILRACEAFDIQYVEQPLPRHDIAGMDRLRSEAALPIAVDEAVTDLESARLLMRAGVADILIVKPQFARGLRMARQVVLDATEQGIQCVVTSAMESGIGVAGALHLVAALPQVTLECGLATLSLLEHDLLVDALLVEDGWMRVPGGCGLGVEPDRQALERYRI